MSRRGVFLVPCLRKYLLHTREGSEDGSVFTAHVGKIAVQLKGLQKYDDGDKG